MNTQKKRKMIPLEAAEERLTLDMVEEFAERVSGVTGAEMEIQAHLYRVIAQIGTDYGATAARSAEYWRAKDQMN
jgi:hypothetical protein